MPGTVPGTETHIVLSLGSDVLEEDIVKQVNI